MLYPEIETLRRDSDTFDVVQDFRQYQLEKNRSEIFSKAPALTMEMMEKINATIVPKKTYLLGYELNTKRILFICGLLLLFFTSLFGAIIMWLTDFFDNTVLSTLIISNSSKHFKLWTNPTPKALVNIHIFNYTNLSEYNDRMEKKLRVQELGPYVYEETMEKVNIEFNNDASKVSYQEKRSYKFRADRSRGKQSDQVTVPNIPMMAGTAMSRYNNFFSRLAFSSFISGIGEKPFVTVPSHGFITGYRNRLLDIFQTLSYFSGMESMLDEKVGLLTSKIGVQRHVYTVNTGKDNIDKLGLIEELNGEEQLDYWSTQECNKIEAADGAMFPPKYVQRQKPLTYFLPDMCRALPLVFDKEEAILNGMIPAYRYIAPDSVYDSADEAPENQCYCSLDSGDCPLKGVFNITPCHSGIPMFVSNPHFYGADEVLLEGVDGLRNVRKEDVQSFVNLHPIMGFVMTGKMTFQLNIQVRKAYGVSQMDRFEDGLMLPIAWFKMELTEDTLPASFLDLIYETTYTLKGVKLAFQYGFLLTTLVTLVCLGLVFKSAWDAPYIIGHSTRNQRTQPVDNIEI